MRFRAAHAKGMMLSGTFTPSREAVSLTRAPHITRSSTPVTVRFSDGTGLPQIPDNSPDSNPKRLAIRFHLADHVHTDIVSHSTDGFPARTGQEFLELRAAIYLLQRPPAPPSFRADSFGFATALTIAGDANMTINPPDRFIGQSMASE